MAAGETQSGDHPHQCLPVARSEGAGGQARSQSRCSPDRPPKAQCAADDSSRSDVRPPRGRAPAHRHSMACRKRFRPAGAPRQTPGPGAGPPAQRQQLRLDGSDNTSEPSCPPKPSNVPDPTESLLRQTRKAGTTRGRRWCRPRQQRNTRKCPDQRGSSECKNSKWAPEKALKEVPVRWRGAPQGQRQSPDAH